MKLIYISPLRYPSEKAGSIFSMKSCEVFADEEVDVELWIPRRLNKLSNQDPYIYFGVKKNFKIRRFPTIDLIKFFPWTFHIMSYSFAFSVFVYVLYLKISSNINNYVFYSHEQTVLYFLTFLSGRTFYEMHDFPEVKKSGKSLQSSFLKRVKGIISTNKWKSNELVERFGLSVSSITTVPNAVDLKDFSLLLSKEQAKNRLKLDQEKHYIGYVGALRTMGMEKGISVLIDSLSSLPENYTLYIIGGEKKDICYYVSYAVSKGLNDRIVFAGNVPHIDIMLHMSVCDCLVAPYPQTDHYSHYMSPMKVFEYMASGRPIIATDLPSIREIVDEDTAFLVPPDDSKAIAEAILKLAGDEEFAKGLTIKARKCAEEKYSWQKRARTILSKIK